MDEPLWDVLHRFDREGYELEFLTQENAVLRRGTQWLTLELSAGRVTVVRSVEREETSWPLRTAPFATLLIVAMLGSLAMAIAAGGRKEPTEAVPPQASVPSEAAPLPNGYELFLFPGGSDAELIDGSHCDSESVAFWATDGMGSFIPLVPSSNVIAVNEPWHQLFPHGVPAGTPLLGRCLRER